MFIDKEQVKMLWIIENYITIHQALYQRYICEEWISQAQKVRQDLPSRRERSNDTLSEVGLLPTEGDDKREG